MLPMTRYHEKNQCNNFFFFMLVCIYTFKVIVHTDRVCFDKDRGCERLLSRDGEILIRPPQEVARIALPDKVLIEERNPGDESASSRQLGSSRSSRRSSAAGLRRASRSKNR